ncbi:MAG: alanine dehydrogenase [Actinomycetes bacterium]|jgi:alanine dehydrogenase|nr:alanine dehydrogenase [Actinomycetes bacterium]
MLVGVPTEIKNNEYRVGLTPSAAADYVAHGHGVCVQAGAGEGSSFPDADYVAAGCKIMPDAAAVFESAEMIVKVKEPQAAEIAMLRPGQILYTYLHLAPDLPQTQGLIQSGAVCIAYETVETAHGALPLLAPMSEVAGRMASQVGAHYLEKPQGGRGVLMGGVPGVPGANVLVLGGGVVGTNAAYVAKGMGAHVTIADVNLDRLRALDEVWGDEVTTLYSSKGNILEVLPAADLVIGAVLLPGAKTPWLITRDMLALMKPASVLVDVSVDQGGCIETTKPTTHADPIYFVDGILHYGVANMPGAVPNTSTRALNHATLRYGLAIADKGWQQALRDDAALAKGANVIDGKVVYKEVADVHGLEYTPLEQLL